MKRFLIVFLMICGFVCVSNAQVQRYQAGSFAIAQVINGSYRWSDWESSSMVIDLDLGRDLITIYSQKTQYYRVMKTDNAYYDNDGGRNVRFYVVDGEGDRGCVRLRIQTDGSSQIYVDFNDVAWVYGRVVRIG